MRRAAAVALAVLAGFAMVACGDDDSDGSGAGSDKGRMILATTTSTQDSGLLDELVPEFQDESGCSVKTVAVGSGEALELGEKGDADVLLVHSPEAETEYMDGGHGASRGAHEDRTGGSSLCVARRRVGHAHEGVVALGGRRDRAGGLVVHRDRSRDGRDTDDRESEAGLHAL